MFCNTCGFEIEEDDQFCRKCGNSVGDSEPARLPKSCVRIQEGKLAQGVCGGVAGYFQIDVTLVRIIWVLAAIIPPLFPGVAAYLVCWLLMPVAGDTESGEAHGVAEAVGSK